MSRAGNTIVNVSRTGNKTRHPDAEKGLSFGKSRNKSSRAFRNAICQDCGLQDKYVRDNRCLSRIDCVYRQLNWEKAGLAPWYHHRSKNGPILTRSMLRFMVKHEVVLTEEEWERQMEFFKERFGAMNG